MYQIKRIYQSILVLGVTAAVFASCTKQLNQQPQSTASNAVVFGSADGLALYSNSFYDGLPAMGDIFRTDCSLSDYGAINAVPDYIRPGVYTSRQSSGWTFTTLRNINFFLENNTNTKISETVRNNYNGMARFFRALFYYNMVRKFGDVPWVTSTISTTDTALLYASRTPRGTVMDSVLVDLNYAIANITTTGDATRSLITKWIAYGLKSRICLFEGTFRKYQTTYNLQSTANAWLQEAATASKAIMDSAGFSLNVSGGNLAYRNLFISTSPVSSEIMLANVTSSSLGVLNDANWYYTSATYGNRFNFTRTFINTYLNIDGTPFTSTAGYDTMTFAHETQNRDLRLAQTIRTPGYTRINSGATVAAPPIFSYTYTGYQPIKWTLDDMYYDGGSLNTNSISIMRYAEILLNYAEARAELGTITDADWAKTIGALRSRAGITGGISSLPTTLDTYMQTNYFSDISDPVIMEIRRERGIELTLEGFRFSDLTRWKHGELLLQSWNGFYVPALNVEMDLNSDGVPDVCFYQGTKPGSTSTVTYVDVSATSGGSTNPMQLSHGTYGEIHWLDNIAREWDDYRYIYPIPYNDITVNPKLGQNPGWTD